MKRQAKKTVNKDERGSALVLTLGVLSLVLIMGMSFAFSSRTSRQVAKVNADQVKANLHSESGLDYALGVMEAGFVEESEGAEVPVLYPAGHKLPSTADDFEKRFEFREHNLGFKDSDGNWSHQHIWSYIPKNNKADDSTDDEIPDDGDTRDEEKNGFKINRLKHSFYYTLMNEVPQLRLQLLQFVEDSATDSNLPTGEEQGTKSNVESYLKKVGFHTITSDDEIVGRVGFLVLEEGQKFDVNQMLTLKINTASGKGNIPFVDHEKPERCADLYTDWGNMDFYYNITGEYKPNEKLNGEEGDTIRWGLHMQELDTGISEYYSNLLKGAESGTVSTKVRWMSYDHLWKGLCPKNADLNDIYGDSLFKDDYMRFTFFSAEEPEAWWYDKDGIEVARFDVTGFEWRESDSVSYYTTTDGSDVKKPATTASANGWEDISGATDKDTRIRDLAFVESDGSKLAMNDSNLPVFKRKKDDYEASDCIPAIGGMKDKNGDSVALQVAANMVDYCDGDDYASVGPEDIRDKLAGTSGISDDIKIHYCGNEKVAYFNELALQFHASRVVDEEGTTFFYRLRMMPQLEMANMFGKDESIPGCKNIVVRVKGKYEINCSKDGEHGTAVNTGTGHDDDHPSASTPDKDFEMIFKATNEGGDWADGYKTGFEFEMLTGNNLILEYKEGYARYEDEVTGEDTVRVYYPPTVEYTVKITSVAMVSWDDGEDADKKVFDIGWWKASDGEGTDAFEMKYKFEGDSYTDIDRYYYGTIEANDPRCNHRSYCWKWKKDGNTELGGYVSDPTSESDFDAITYHTLGKADGNTNYKPGDASEYYGSDENLDLEKDNVKIYEISTSFIRNAPFETLWELGAIHRGEPFRTINLSVFSQDFEEDSFSGKYDDGDAHILDQVKIGPARYSKGKFNVNSRSVASYVMLYNEDCFGEDDTYDNPSKQGDPLKKPVWDFKDAEPHFSRGQIAGLMKIEDDDYDNDRQLESFIGRTANLLTTRNEAYTLIVISQALQERKDLVDAMTTAGMSDDQKKDLVKANMANPTWYKVYEDADTSNEHLCEILGTNVIMAHVVRDAWTGKMTVVKKEYLNSSK